jgi:hypothetical protein
MQQNGQANRKKGNIRLSIGLLTVSVLVLFNFQLLAQDTTSTNGNSAKAHSIKRAALYSAALPGLGQIYNRKAWKVPIIYAGFGVLGYFIYSNNDEYQLYKEAYVYVANSETYPIDNPYVDKYDQDQLQRAMDYYRRNRDLSIIITSLWYVLNILEAYVDAHFFDYDVSEDLSLQFSPAINPIFARSTAINPGLKITLNF